MPAERKSESVSTSPVLCAKCRHSNPREANHCEKCGARLYITCHNCGHSTSRIATRCAYCGHRLHRSFWSRVRRRVFGRNSKITPFQIALLIAFVFLAYKTIIYIAEYRPPLYTGE